MTIKPLRIFSTNWPIIFNYNRLFPINHLTILCPSHERIPLFATLVQEYHSFTPSEILWLILILLWPVRWPKKYDCFLFVPVTFNTVAFVSIWSRNLTINRDRDACLWPPLSWRPCCLFFLSFLLFGLLALVDYVFSSLLDNIAFPPIN